LNHITERKVARFGWTFAPGDKVMQIENDYDKEVYNGDIGYIDDVDPKAGELVASFDGRPMTSGFGEYTGSDLCRHHPQEAFDEVKDGHPRRAVRSETAPIDQSHSGVAKKLSHTALS
jgi:hypothetical protein